MNQILIAEDESAIASLVRAALDGPDYRCTWAADGLTACDLLEREPFDLVLLDIMLPGADGYQVLDYCRALEVPVIFLTAKEYELLLLFVQNKNIALYRDRIYEKVWGDEYLGDSWTVDLHIQRMRKKLGLEKRLVAVYKVGYRLEV